MELFFIVLLLIVHTVLGLAVLLRNPRLQLNRFYVLFVFSLNVWIFANYLENEPLRVGYETLPFFLKLDFAMAPILFYFLFRFAATFVNDALERAEYAWLRTILFVGILPAVAGPFLAAQLLVDISFYDNVIHFKDGPLMPYYVAVIALYILGSLAILWGGRRAANRGGNVLKRRQIDYIFLGAALSLGTAVVVNLAQSFFPIPLVISRLGLFGMVFLVTLSGYAVVRAQFFELRLALVRAIGFLVLSTAIAAAYAFILFIIAREIFQVFIDTRLFISAIAIAVIIATTFDYIRVEIERLTDRIFFKGRYDGEQVLRKIGRILIETIELEEMTGQIVAILRVELRLRSIAMAIESNYGIQSYIEGFEKDFKRDIPQLLRDTGKSVLSYDDLPEGDIKRLFKKHNIALSVPLKLKTRDYAVLFIGHKLSGEPLSENDISFHELLSSEVSIGIENARSYDRLKLLSQELEKRVEERTAELEKLQKEELIKAKEVAKLKDEFVFLAVHELRAPVMAIKGFLELTDEAQKHFPKDVQGNMAAMAQASAHLNQLISDILEIARSDSGVAKIVMQPQSFKPVLDDVLLETKSLFAAKNIKLSVHVGRIPKVLCDVTQIREVLMNLVSNAIKYNREGGTIDITVFRQPGEPTMVFEIRDTGYGIPKEQQAKIFQKFFRASSSETQATLGTGLGLFITRMLIEKMGGAMTFSSVEGEGSTFAFTLPLAEKK